jgi:hypothetical protein
MLFQINPLPYLSFQVCFSLDIFGRRSNSSSD